MSSEGISFCEIKEITETPIEEIMVCLAHDSNTVSKKQWLSDAYKSPIDMIWYKRHLEILSVSNI
jgi:hypothetical protein